MNNCAHILFFEINVWNVIEKKEKEISEGKESKMKFHFLTAIFL